MPDDMVTITVSGKAYSAALDPLATQVPKEEGWPDATLSRRGKGWSAQYVVTRAQAADMAQHLRDLGGDFITVDDPESRAEGRACLEAAAKVRAVLGLVA